jgi:hypothetical protein
MADLDEIALRRAIDARPERPGDAICEAVAAAVADALADGGLIDRLALAGWRVVRAPGGHAPDAPEEWMHDGLDTALPGWRDPLAQLDALWARAWRAGYLAAGADQAAAVDVDRVTAGLRAEIDRLGRERDSMVWDLFGALYPEDARPDRPIDTVWDHCVHEAGRLAALHDAQPLDGPG